MRINKYIASSGICSRRKADSLIEDGKVKVNGAVLNTPGYDVVDGDKVEVNGKVISLSNDKVYVLVNKPLGYVSTVSDTHGRNTVVELVADFDERLFPVGRLDYNTTGALIMTNDGDFANMLMHPKHEIYKTYRAKVAGVFSEEKARKLRSGIYIEEERYKTAPAKVSILRTVSGTTLVEISIREGKKREVRNMFSTLGNPVIELERIAIGPVNLGHLAIGHYRKLTEKEIEQIREKSL